MLLNFNLVNTCSIDVIRDLGYILWFKCIEVPSRKRSAPRNAFKKVLLFIIWLTRHQTVQITVIVTEEMPESNHWRWNVGLLLSWCGVRYKGVCVGRLSRHLTWKVWSITLGVCWGCRWGSRSCMPWTEMACGFHITRYECLITVPIIPCKINDIFLFHFCWDNTGSFLGWIYSFCYLWKEPDINVWLNICNGIVVVSQRVLVIMCELDMHNFLWILRYEVKNLHTPRIVLVNV